MQRSRRRLYPAVVGCTASLVIVGGGIAAASLSAGTNTTADVAANQSNRGDVPSHKPTVGTHDIKNYAVTKKKLSKGVWKKIKSSGSQGPAGPAGPGGASSVYVAADSQVPISSALTPILTTTIPTAGSFLVSFSGHLNSSSAAQQILCQVTTSAGSFIKQPLTVVSMPKDALATSYLGGTGWITSSTATTLTLQCGSVDARGTAGIGNPTLTALEVDSIS